MKRKALVVLIAPLAVALGIAAAPAAAQRGGGGPCRQDIEKLCPNIKPGGGAFRNCLEQHASELSPACQQHLSQMKARLQALQQACQDDIQKLCANVPSGGGNLMRCLRDHHDQLSQTCQDQIAKTRHGRGRRGPAAQPGNQPSGS
jgi:Cysteine rich repeat